MNWSEIVKTEDKGKEFLNKNKTEILNFLGRVKHVTIVLVLTLIVFVYVFIYKTMVGESQNALVDKFVETGNLNYHMLKHSIDRAEESARSLSSRTMIKGAINEYLDGEKTIEELKIYTKDKYRDGAKALDNIIYAERIVGEESIAKYYRTNAAIPENPLRSGSSIDSVITTIDEDRSTVLIQSPIISDRGIIGHDYLIYKIKSELDSLTTTEIKVGLICNKEYLSLLENSKVLELQDDRRVLETATDFYAEYQIKDKYFYTQIAKADLFQHLNTVVQQIFIGSIIIFIIASGVIYLFIIRYAKDKLERLNESRQEFKNLAYYDQLTNAYSRSFLEVWDRNYRDKDELHAIVMVDVNDFKIINDTYGHSEGDSALKEVVETIMNNLRDHDLVVRFGGDEFLLILPGSTIDDAQKVMTRVEKQLSIIEGIPIPVTISFGISSFREKSSEEAIKEADRLMYQDKIRRKNKRADE